MPDDRRDALDVLHKVLKWELTAQRWDDVARLVGALQDAFDRGDGEAFRRAAIELEVGGPVRAASAEHPPTEPPGNRVREWINHLIHALAPPKRDPASPASLAEGRVDPPR